MPAQKINFEPTEWKNDSEPDITEDQLNRIERGIAKAYETINALVDDYKNLISSSALYTQRGLAALDVVENNPNVSGTLANKISQLNSDLTHSVLTDVVRFNTTYASASACSAVKYGGLMDFQLWIILSAMEFQTGVEYHIGYINNPKFYPRQARTVIYGANNGVATRIDIGNDGVIKITPYGKITGGTIVFPFCYTVQ